MGGGEEGGREGERHGGHARWERANKASRRYNKALQMNPASKPKSEIATV